MMSVTFSFTVFWPCSQEKKQEIEGRLEMHVKIPQTDYPSPYRVVDLGHFRHAIQVVYTCIISGQTSTSCENNSVSVSNKFCFGCIKKKRDYHLTKEWTLLTSTSSLFLLKHIARFFVMIRGKLINLVYGKPIYSFLVPL